MTGPDERVWLRHNETGHFFHCPAGAVADHKDLGWLPTDERPVERNPMTAEMPAEWFAPIPGPEPEKPTKKQPRAGSSTEGSDTVG